MGIILSILNIVETILVQECGSNEFCRVYYLADHMELGGFVILNMNSHLKSNWTAFGYYLDKMSLLSHCG